MLLNAKNTILNTLQMEAQPQQIILMLLLVSKNMFNNSEYNKYGTKIAKAGKVKPQ